MKKSLLCLLLALVVAAPAAMAQDEYVELMRQDLRADKVAIVTAAMDLASEQGDVFWPIYREYDAELTKIWDERLALIERYAETYEAMDEATADEISTAAVNLVDKRLDLRKKYFKQMKKELGAIVAARFWQVDGVIQNIVDLQISAELPLVEATGTAAGER